MQVNYNELKNIYENEVRVKTKNKKKVYKFDMYESENLISCYNTITLDSYIPNKYNIFLIRSPKYRVVMSQSIPDKIINHWFTRNVLMPKLEKFLDCRNVATRRNMGRDYGIRLVKKYIEYYKNTNKECYILKLDIKKYFYNIDHNILKNMLKNYLTIDEYEMARAIIDSTDLEYVNKSIIYLKTKELSKINERIDEVKDIPLYESGKGLPIGNMSSQFLAIYYLSGLDHTIVHDFKIKHFCRYMDDLLLFSSDKEYLNSLIEKIEYILNNVYKLELNKKKTMIVSINEGFVFCGYHFRVINNKTVVTVASATRKRIKKRIKEVKYLYDINKITLEKAFCSIETYYNGFKYGDSKRIKRMVDRYFFDYGKY